MLYMRHAEIKKSFIKIYYRKHILFYFNLCFFSEITSQPDWHHQSFSHGDGFFVVEPGVKLELNVIKKLRVGLGISYRYSPNLDHRNTSTDVMDQFIARLSFRFGKY